MPAKYANYAKVGERPTEYTEDTERETWEKRGGRVGDPALLGEGGELGEIGLFGGGGEVGDFEAGAGDF